MFNFYFLERIQPLNNIFKITFLPRSQYNSQFSKKFKLLTNYIVDQGIKINREPHKAVPSKNKKP